MRSEALPARRRRAARPAAAAPRRGRAVPRRRPRRRGSHESLPTTAKRPPTVVTRCGRPAQVDGDAGARQRACRRIPDDLLQRGAVQADVPGRRVAEQALLEDERAERQRGLGGRQIQRRQRDQVPQRRDRPRALPVLAQPGSPACASRRAADASERERRAPRRDALAQREVASSAGALRRGAAGAARRCAAGERSGAPGRARECPGAAAARRQRLALEAREQLAVGGAAAQEHVLAVVDPKSVALRPSRRRRPAAGAPRRASPRRRPARSRAPRRSRRRRRR